MASVFDIFGSINLETRAFEGSLRSVVGKLQNADKELDTVIAKSNRLGDTSATVARRIEKLAEGIQAERNRLLDNALAFEKGEISAKKWASVQASVEKATASLTSRISDAKARLVELDETGLTHFQQQITTAVQTGTNQLESFRQKILQTQQTASPQAGILKNLFGGLSGQQKTQLSFQLNDIITGLLSGQNPGMIAAQQGGQIVQIFQQSRAAQEGVAAATTTAATAQAAMAVSSQATATSMQAAAGSATILGASAVGLTGILAAGLVTIGAVYRIVKDIEAARKNALAVEVAISKELNEQLLSRTNLQKLLAEAADKRGLDSLAETGSIPDIQMAIDRLMRERNALDAAVLAEKQKRGAIVSAIKPNAEFARQFVDEGETEAQKKLKETLDAEIGRLTAQIDNLRRQRRDSASEFIQGTGARTAKAYQESLKQAGEAEQKLAEHRKKLIEKAKEDARKFAEHVKGAAAEVRNVFGATTDNPFTRIFLNGEAAVMKMLEATKGLGKELQNNLRRLIESDTATKVYKQSLDNALNASNLRAEAARFASGDSVEESVARRARMMMFANYSSTAARNAHFQQLVKDISVRDFQENIARQFGAIGATGNIALLNEGKLAELDKKIIAITQGVDPSKLNRQQQQVAAAARLREADREETEQKEDREIRKEMRDYLKKLLEGKALEIEVSDPQGLTSGIKSATPQTVNARYKQ